jgi:hypothetical protein
MRYSGVPFSEQSQSVPMHTLTGTQIRDFTHYIRTLCRYQLENLLLDNAQMGRDACVALIEFELSRRYL